MILPPPIRTLRADKAHVSTSIYFCQMTWLAKAWMLSSNKCNWMVRLTKTLSLPAKGSPWAILCCRNSCQATWKSMLLQRRPLTWILQWCPPELPKGCRHSKSNNLSVTMSTTKRKKMMPRAAIVMRVFLAMRVTMKKMNTELYNIVRACLIWN